MDSEFELIKKYFYKPIKQNNFVKKGIGDDCALISMIPNKLLAVSSDMLIQDIHFFPNSDPEKLGYKALAVNLSDIAAMGAKPLAFNLSISLPKIDHKWLKNFSKGLFSLADFFNIDLIGGDTTKGNLCICISVIGCLSKNYVLTRDGAKKNDNIWVSGNLGDARLTLEILKGNLNLKKNMQLKIQDSLHKPLPRVSLGLALRGIATSAIDISDGLYGDLKHILNLSKLGATIYSEKLPISDVLKTQPKDIQLKCALNGGDDYELCFTAPKNKTNEVLKASKISNTKVTYIGELNLTKKIIIKDIDRKSINILNDSFDHFKKI